MADLLEVGRFLGIFRMGGSLINGGQGCLLFTAMASSALLCRHGDAYGGLRLGL
jgi:hypothetical protein